MQTSYGEQDRAFAGMLGDLTLKQASTRIQGEASAEIPFGAMVAEGTAPSGGSPGTCILLADANSVLAGVALHSHDYDNRTELGDTGLKPKTAISVLERGRVWVPVEEAVVPGDPVFVRHTAGAGGSQKGAFRTDADTATAVQVHGARWVKGSEGDGFAMVEIDMAAHRAALTAP